MKRKRPVLYELLSPGSEPEPPPPPPPPKKEKKKKKERPRIEQAAPIVRDESPQRSGPSEESDGIMAWLAAGRTLEIPVGYVFVACAAVMLIGAAAYVFGFSRGRGADDTVAHRDAASLAEGDGIAEGETGIDGRFPEPGNRLLGQAAGGRGTNTLRGVTPLSERGATTRSSPGGFASAGPIESDPRREGLNYFALIHTTRRNALKVAEFCRANQLEAYVVPAKNDSFRVFVLPGYAAEEEQSGFVKDLIRRIEEVRIKWKAHTNRDDLSGYIPYKYKG